MFHIVQEAHTVNVLPPQDLAGGPVTGDRFTMRNHYLCAAAHK